MTASNALTTDFSEISVSWPVASPVQASIMCPAAAHVQSPSRSFAYIGHSATCLVASKDAGGAGSFALST